MITKQSCMVPERLTELALERRVAQGSVSTCKRKISLPNGSKRRSLRTNITDSHHPHWLEPWLGVTVHQYTLPLNVDLMELRCILVNPRLWQATVHNALIMPPQHQHNVTIPALLVESCLGARSGTYNTSNQRKEELQLARHSTRVIG